MLTDTEEEKSVQKQKKNKLYERHVHLNHINAYEKRDNDIIWKNSQKRKKTRGKRTRTITQRNKQEATNNSCSHA